MNTIAQYAKFIMTLLGVIATVVTTQFPSSSHWVSVIIAAVTAVLVVFVPNASSKVAAKA